MGVSLPTDNATFFLRFQSMQYMSSSGWLSSKLYSKIVPPWKYYPGHVWQVSYCTGLPMKCRVRINVSHFMIPNTITKTYHTKKIRKTFLRSRREKSEEKINLRVIKNWGNFAPLTNQCAIPRIKEIPPFTSVGGMLSP